MNIELNNSEIKVLDHGFVRLVDCMPRHIPRGCEKLRCDYAVAEAARVSYGEQIRGGDADAKLIRYLLRNKHTSPFEMVRFKFHIKLPIFVQRQLIRHRTANVNEISGRYTKLKDDFYEPKNIRGQSLTNHQGSSDAPMVVDDNLEGIYNNYMGTNKSTYDLYNKLIESGVAKELARVSLPQNIYTELYWCIDLHNLLRFLSLRKSKHAQYEIMVYASAMEKLIQDLCPITIGAYNEFVEDSITFSKAEMGLIKSYLQGDTTTLSGKFKTKREEEEFINKMKLF